MAGEFAGAIGRRRRDKDRAVAAVGRPVGTRGCRRATATAKALATLPSDSWVVLHDVRWPGRPFANIDHVAIGPTGVFVIDSRNWSGSVELDYRVLQQNGRPRGRELVSAWESAAAVARQLVFLPSVRVVPVLCLVGSNVTGWAESVIVSDAPNVVHALTSRRPVMSPDQVRAVANELRWRLQNAPEPRRTAGIAWARTAPRQVRPRREPARSRQRQGELHRHADRGGSDRDRGVHPTGGHGPRRLLRPDRRLRIGEGARRPARPCVRTRATAARRSTRSAASARTSLRRSTRNGRSAIVRVLPSS